MVAKVEIVKLGSNRLRQKLNHIPALELSANKLQEPIIKGRGYKARAASVDKRKQTVEKKGGAKSSRRSKSIQLDD